MSLPGCGLLRRCLRRWGSRLCGRGEHKALANHGESGLGQFSLKKLVFGSGKQIGLGAGNGRDKMVDRDRLAVDGSLHIGERSEHYWLNGA